MGKTTITHTRIVLYVFPKAGNCSRRYAKMGKRPVYKHGHSLKYFSVPSSGFTLVELMVVVAVLGILVAIAVPIYSSSTEAAKIATDEANLRILNSASVMYRIDSGVIDVDLFVGIETDAQRIQKLVELNYIAVPVKEQHPSHRFAWDLRAPAEGGQVWRMDGSVNPDGPVTGSIKYNFTMLTEEQINSFVNRWKDERPWIFDPTLGLKAGPYAVGVKEHLLFHENPYEEYVITSNIALGSGKDGGYGIMFESALSNVINDTGFIMQFDRGYNPPNIIIRPRENGSEKGSVYNYVSSTNNSLPANNSAWWAEEKKVVLEVSKLEQLGNKGENKKLYTIISSTTEPKVIGFTWHFKSSVNTETNNMGFRTWHSGSDNAVIKDLEIKELIR
jgi:prepilin-type N-terminal cleavage/methylation domain-containing protein